MSELLELLREKKRRLLARQTLQAFTEATTPNWHAGKIHRVIGEQCDRVVKREIDRLMFLCPPQHGKSQLVSRRLPAFLLGHEPTEDWISASATADLAEGFGRDVRNCMGSSEYKAIFPDTQLAEDSQAKGRWHTKQGGGYVAIGIGGQLYGKGGGAIIDDPFGSWADAQSALEREKVWDWYRGTLYNRIRPKRPIIVIQHRMYEDDLAGRLIEQQKCGGDKWEIVELPASLEDPPWPERYDRDALQRIKSNTDPRQWAALYMQNPTPDDGTFFLREWFKFVDPKSVTGHKYTSGDFAVTEDGGDTTELGTHAYGDMLTLGIDGWSGKTTADVWIERLVDQFATHKPLCFFGESGPIRRSIEPFLKRRMLERKAYCRMEWLTRPHDKPTMARPLQAMASMGRVQIADTEYGHYLLGQLLKFPGGGLDATDMAGLMGLAIDQVHPAMTVAPVPVVKRDGYDRVHEEDSWRVA